MVMCLFSPGVSPNQSAIPLPSLQPFLPLFDLLHLLLLPVVLLPLHMMFLFLLFLLCFFFFFEGG